MNKDFAFTSHLHDVHILAAAAAAGVVLTRNHYKPETQFVWRRQILDSTTIPVLAISDLSCKPELNIYSSFSGGSSGMTAVVMRISTQVFRYLYCMSCLHFKEHSLAVLVIQLREYDGFICLKCVIPTTVKINKLRGCQLRQLKSWFILEVDILLHCCHHVCLCLCVFVDSWFMRSFWDFWSRLIFSRTSSKSLSTRSLC